jgi:hypothetical protein
MNEQVIMALLDQITERFRARLQRKTGWGRNEVMLELQTAMTHAVAGIAELLTDAQNQELD